MNQFQFSRFKSLIHSIFWPLRTDPEVLKELAPWREIVNRSGNTKVGTLRVPLLKTDCNFAECNLGNLFADSYVHHYATAESTAMGTWTPASIAIVLTGGLRATISKGRTYDVNLFAFEFPNNIVKTFAAITYSDLITAMPFENSVDTVDLSGSVLKDVLEYSVSASWSPKKFIGKYMCQVAGNYQKKKFHSNSKHIELSLRLHFRPKV